jgi:hypothetical protein
MRYYFQYRQIQFTFSFPQINNGGKLMARKKQSQGTCEFCGREMSKGGMSKHLSACPQRQANKEALWELPW